MTETSPIYKNLSEIVAQLEWCGYECEAGPLTHNTAFIALKEMAAQGEFVPEPLQLHIKNQLGNNLAIEFCCGADKECVLQPEEETVIEIAEDVCMYLDSVHGKDTKLHAAAPSLLHACKTVLPWLKEIPCDDPDDSPLISELESAIRNAEGKPCGG